MFKNRGNWRKREFPSGGIRTWQRKFSKVQTSVKRRKLGGFVFWFLAFRGSAVDYGRQYETRDTSRNQGLYDLDGATDAVASGEKALSLLKARNFKCIDLIMSEIKISVATISPAFGKQGHIPCRRDPILRCGRRIACHSGTHQRDYAA